MIFIKEELNIFAMSIGIPALRTMLVEDLEASAMFYSAIGGDDGKVSPFDFDNALIENIESIIRIGVHELEVTGRINEPTLIYHWRPVHVAVITGHDDVLRRLIISNARLDLVDAKGMTPLHYAALLGRTKHIKMLLEAGASMDIECATGGTYLDIQRCLELPPPSCIIPLQLLGEKGGQKLTSPEFKKITQTTYLFENWLTPDLMFQGIFDRSVKEKEYPFEKWYAYNYWRFRRNAPLLCLKEVTADSSGAPLPFPLGLGLFATTTIEKNAYIGEFMGVFSDPCPESHYSLCFANGEGVHAQKYRNEIPMCNDGFPNMVLVPIQNVAGLPCRYIFIACDKIEQGDQLCWNYGYNTHLKYDSPYVELRKKEAHAFIGKHSTSYLLELTDKVAKKVCTLKEYYLAEQFRYIVQTLPVFFSIAPSLTLKNNAKLFKAINKLIPAGNGTLATFVIACKAIQGCFLAEQALRATMPALVPKFKKWISSIPSLCALDVGVEITLHSNREILDILHSKLSEKEAIERWKEFEHKQRTIAKESLTKFFKFSK